jgi:hypothetical protein
VPMRYLYSLVRFVPDPARGEFVNVGVIVGSDEAREWEFRAIENLQRARHLDDPGRRSLAAVTDFVERLANEVDEFSEATEEGYTPQGFVSEAWLTMLQEDMERVVQLTPLVPIRADSAEEALSRLFQQLVVDPVQERLSYLRKTRAAAALRRAYLFADLIDPERYVFENVRVRAGSHGSHLDFAVANGTVVQLAQTWSFQVPDQTRLIERVRSWGWTMERLKASGGEVTLPGDRVQQVARGVDIEVVFVPPREEQRDDSAFRDALGVFDEIGASAVPLKEAATVAARASVLLAPHLHHERE